MKIVLTIEEVKNIICDFVHKKEGGERPKEVAFIIRQSGEDNRETEEFVEVRY